MKLNYKKLNALILILVVISGIIKLPIYATEINNKVDVVFVIDQSGSMNGYGGNDSFCHRISSIKNFVSAQMDTTLERIGFVQAGEDAEQTQALTSDKTALLKSLDSMVDVNLAISNLSTGVDSAVNMLSGSTNKKVIIIITDGIADSSQSDLLEKVKSAAWSSANKNVIVNTVALGDDNNTSILKEIASRTNGSYCYISGTSWLNIIDANDNYEIDLDNRMGLIYKSLIKGNRFIVNVMDGDTWNSLSGATVTAGDQTVVTDDKGAAEFYGIIPGTADIHITKDGYDENSYDKYSVTNNNGNLIIPMRPANSATSVLTKFAQYGNFNADGAVNSVDYSILLRYLSGTTGTINKTAADLNGDGSIDSNDSLLMKQFLIKAIKKFPADNYKELVNGDFENKLDGWTTGGSASIASQYEDIKPTSGNNMAMMSDSTDSFISQKIYIPKSVTTVSFDAYGICEEPVKLSLNNDYKDGIEFDLTNDDNGSLSDTEYYRWNDSIDVKNYQGQYLTLKFHVPDYNTSGNSRRSLIIDNIRLERNLKISSDPGTTISVNDNLAIPNQANLYKYIAPTTGLYRIYSSDINVDVKAWLYSGAKGLITSDDDSAGNKNFRIAYNLIGGNTYYLKVSHNNLNGTGSYTLNVDAPDDYGNNLNSAVDITVASSAYSNFFGQINSPIDVDCLKFEVPTTGTYVIYSVVSASDLRGAVYDSDQKEMINDDNSGGNRIFKMACNFTAGDTYYLKMNSVNGTGPYKITITSDNFIDIYNNDLSATPFSLQVGKEITGSINVAGDSDCFQFIPEEDGIYCIESTGGTDTVGELFDSDGESIQTNDDSDGSLNFKTYALLGAGELCYVKASGYEDCTGAYGLKVTKIKDDYSNEADILIDLSILEDGDTPVVEPTTVISTNGSATNGRIDYPGDMDVFAVNIDSASEGNYKITCDGGENAEISLYDSELNLIDTAEYDENALNTILTEDLTQGKYYIYISNSDEISGTGDYKLSVSK